MLMLQTEENEQKEYNELNPDRPELKNKKSQKLKFLCPPANLSYHPRTLFFLL